MGFLSSSIDRIRISAIGTYIPAGRVANAERLSEFGLQEDFLRTKLGVVTRALKSPDEDTSDLCVKAFADLTAQVAVSLSDVQLCCVVTQNPDRGIPHCAAIVHHKLGLARSCMTFDLSQGCAGYVHGLALVSSLMTSLRLQQALLFTCDPYSKIINPADKNTALIFGDAASVTYLRRDGAGYALIDASFGTEPGSSACLTLDSAHGQDGQGPRLHMDGAAVLYHATRLIPANLRELLERNQLSLAQIDRFLLHPGSLRVVELIRKDLKLPPDKVPFEIEHYGNTVSSSIPLLFKPYVREQRCQRLVLSGFGVGFSWGSCIAELRPAGS